MLGGGVPKPSASNMLPNSSSKLSRIGEDMKQKKQKLRTELTTKEQKLTRKFEPT